MDEHLETSWCPGCDRHIEPAKMTVHVDQHGRQINMLNSEHQPAVGSPLVTRKTTTTTTLLPAPPGLVRGTGRVAPNGALLPTTTATKGVPPVPPPSPVLTRTKPVGPLKTRTVISQDQTPLYCSPACRQKDALRLEHAELARRASSTSSGTTHSSLFERRERGQGSASSLDSCEVPPASPPKQHPLQWTDSKAQQRQNDVRAPSPEPLAFLAPRALLASARPAPAETTAVHVSSVENNSSSSDLTRRYFDECMPMVNMKQREKARTASSSTSRSSSLSSLASSSSKKSSSRRHRKVADLPAFFRDVPFDYSAWDDFETEDEFIANRMPDACRARLAARNPLFLNSFEREQRKRDQTALPTPQWKLDQVERELRAQYPDFVREINARKAVEPYAKGNPGADQPNPFTGEPMTEADFRALVHERLLEPKTSREFAIAFGSAVGRTMWDVVRETGCHWSEVTRGQVHEVWGRNLVLVTRPVQSL